MQDGSSLSLRLGLFVIAIWMGALWSACVLVPAVSFTVLPDPSLAGRVAGRSFWVVSIIGGVSAVISTALVHRQQTRTWLLLALVCAALPILSEGLVGPAMRAARAMGDSNAVRTFHSIASALFLSAAILSVVLFWLQSRLLVNRPAR